eukprot:gene24356-31699_t
MSKGPGFIGLIDSGFSAAFRLSQQTKDEEDLKEKHFLMNITRMSGKTSVVTPECMFEFIVYVQNQGIREMAFVEESYFDSLFSNDEFLTSAVIPVCSVEFVIKAYEKAKTEDNIVVLASFRAAHRKARSFLDDESVKQQLTDYLSHRENETRRQLYFKALYPILNCLQRYGINSVLGRAYATFLPVITSKETLRTLYQ